MIQFIKKTTLRDLILILSLLAVALIALGIARAAAKEGTRVAVIVDNVTIAEYPLSADGEHLLLGGKNTLVIEDGEAYMRESQCPDHLCERYGRISRSGERIVCLPHHLTVKIR